MYRSVNRNFNELIWELNNNKSTLVSLATYNSLEILMQRDFLKSARVINDEQYELLSELKSKIEDFQTYRHSSSLDEIQKIIKSYQGLSQRPSVVEEKLNSFEENIQNLSISSKESIVNAEKFDDFSNYIHVKREIEETLLRECINLDSVDSGLILLVGSVGDGKSHLLAYLKDKYPEIFENIIVHNDATESNNPSYTASQTLEAMLREIYKNNKKIVIAINIGMLHNFYSFLERENSLLEFRSFIDESGILNSEGESKHKYISENYKNHSIVSFLNEQKLIIENGEITNDFYKKLIGKLCSETEDNPLYSSFINEDGYQRKESLYKNYALLLNKEVQESIIYLLNLIQVQDKRILTARSVLNFIYDIIVPTNTDKNEHSQLLPSLLFDSKERSKILESIHTHDPSHNNIQFFEDLNVRIYNADNLIYVCQSLFKNDYEKVESILNFSNLISQKHSEKYRIIVRLYFLLNYEEFATEDYKHYLKVLENKDVNLLKSFLKDLELVTYRWNGSPKENYIYKKPWNIDDSIRVAIEFNFAFKEIEIQENSIFISVYNENEERSFRYPYKLEIDYPLYILIKKVSLGYMIKSNDRNDAINFNEFMEDIIENTLSMRSTIIRMNSSNRLFKISSGILNPEIEELI